MSATPVAREGAREALTFAQRLYAQATTPGMDPIGDVIASMAKAIEARDASAVEGERTLRKALEVHAFAEADDGSGLNRDECGTCWRSAKWCDERVGQGRTVCKGHDARAALARVASLKGAAK